MECTFEDLDDVLKVTLDGRFVAAFAEEVREQISKRMERCSNVLIDLSKMEHVDSSGLGVLVQMLQRAQEAGGTVVLAGLMPHPRVVFDITKTYRLFEIFDTVDAALTALRGR